MEYHKIVAVTGLPGLFELINSKTDGAIVRSLDDKSTRFVSSRVHNFSHLESIEVFTTRDNVNLVEVLNAMDAAKEKLPDEKDNNALKAYFKKVYPELDLDRVYSSDLKKMVKWFAVLKSNEVEIKLSAPPEESAEPEEVVKEEEVKEEIPVKATAKAPKETKPEPKAVPKKKEPEVKAVKEEKPAKAAAKPAKETKAEPKAAPKKKAKEEEAKPKKAAPAKKKSAK